MKRCFLFLLLSLLVAFSFAQTTLLRGPYLQAATDTSVHIRWRTDAAESGRVQWGTAAGSFAFFKQETAPTTEHEVKLTGLQPGTKYRYSIGSNAAVLQGGADNYFTTLPVRGAKTPVRIGVIGDCGNNSVNQINVRNQLKAYLGATDMTAWILLGDNAYSYGYDAEYQATFFNIYQEYFLKQSPLYPSPGNHDYADNAVLQNTHAIPYYDVFTMPVDGEAGGVPSGNEAYYSFDVGNVHFLSLDSYGQEDNSTRLYDTLGKQVQWIKQDLAANQNKDWVVAYWHHAPFSLGSRNGETEADMTAIRKNFIRILERYGVDLILCGHSHNYERTRLQKGFYGYEAEFNASLHNLSSSSGLYDGSAASCPYTKDTVNNAGTVYVVAGSAGQLGLASAGYPHDAMQYANTAVGGSMILEVNGNRLDAKWICADGVIRDKFTMMKAVNTKKTIAFNAGDSVVLTASYNGNYNWTPGGATTKSIKVSPLANTTYYVGDDYNCLRDTFAVTINNVPLPLVWEGFNGRYDKQTASVRLAWTTRAEQGTIRFEVERSADGTAFTQIGSVPASGTSSSAYAFTDAGIDPAKAVCYYRIKWVDQSGATRHSPTIAVALSGRLPYDVQVVPNPSKPGEARIRLLNTTNEVPATVSVADASGKVVTTKQLVLQARPQAFLPAVSKGIYLVTVQTDSGLQTFRLLIE